MPLLAVCFLLFSAPNFTAARRDSPIYPLCKNQRHTSYVRVKGETQLLQEAINNAIPGTLIEMRPGVYDRPRLFNITVNQKHGTATEPITICGPRRAVISAEGDYDTHPYVFHIQDSSHINLAGFTVFKGLKGVVVERSHHVVLRRLWVHTVDQEGIRVRHNSTNVAIKGCMVTDTGRTAPGIGEGIYVGSSYNSALDMCLNTTIVGNRIGPGVTAECIDVKENTQGGLIQRNVLDGSGMGGENFADSWVDIKGTGWVVEGNTGYNTVLDGFTTHVKPGLLSGQYNVFASNTCHLGTGTGDCIGVFCGDLNSPSPGCDNTVKCDNVAVEGTVSNLQDCTK